MAISNLRVMGRATQGVRLINIKGNDSIAAVTKVLREEEVEGIVEDIDGEVVEGETINENQDESSSDEENSAEEEVQE